MERSDDEGDLSPLERAIVEHFQTDRKGIATGWFLIVEGIDDEGNRWLTFKCDHDSRTWQVRGWLHHALDDLAGQEVVSLMTEED